MKYTIRKITEGEDEVVIHCREMTSQIERMIRLLNGEDRKLIGWNGKTFAYMEKEILRLDDTLNQLEQILNDVNFFRCSKSMILNIDRVRTLRSMSSNRIDATMQNGEHIIISRTYASDFRKRLKGGRISCYKIISPFSYANAADLFSTGELSVSATVIGVAMLVMGIVTVYIVYTRRDLTA